MPLDPRIAEIVELVNALDPPPPSFEGVDEMREAYAALCLALTDATPEVQRDDLEVGDRAVARYLGTAEAHGDAASEQRRPTLVWVHGGGWVIGDLDTHDAMCRSLARACGVQVLSLEYRRAPEHRFPTAHDDVSELCAALVDDHGSARVDPSRWALGGDSAGAHIATVVARRRRDAGLSLPTLQVLAYPVTDLAGHDEHPSYHDNAEGYLLTAAAMRFFADAYVPDVGARMQPDVSPLRSVDLEGLPPALVLTAQYDPLRDEGRAYADRLAAAGVLTEHLHYDAATHMFLQMGRTDLARGAFARIGDAVRSAVSPSGRSPR